MSGLVLRSICPCTLLPRHPFVLAHSCLPVTVAAPEPGDGAMHDAHEEDGGVVITTITGRASTAVPGDGINEEVDAEQGGVAIPRPALPPADLAALYTLPSSPLSADSPPHTAATAVSGVGLVQDVDEEEEEEDDDDDFAISTTSPSTPVASIFSLPRASMADHPSRPAPVAVISGDGIMEDEDGDDDDFAISTSSPSPPVRRVPGHIREEGDDEGATWQFQLLMWLLWAHVRQNGGGVWLGEG